MCRRRCPSVWFISYEHNIIVNCVFAICRRGQRADVCVGRCLRRPSCRGVCLDDDNIIWSKPLLVLNSSNLIRFRPSLESLKRIFWLFEWNVDNVRINTFQRFVVFPILLNIIINLWWVNQRFVCREVSENNARTYVCMDKWVVVYIIIYCCYLIEGRYR